ncbi:MAG: hypothetical protein JNM93_09075 [Bacteriovoracaceae bacterium]|nr:hypothetical protein [Bacteriovoracaceae bacterium]
MKKWLLLPLLLLISCNTEEFGASSQGGSVGVDPIVQYQVQGCSASTLVKPPVDILFLIDNSASVYHLNDALRQAMANTLTQVSDDFDYRAMVAPLIPESTNENLTNFPVVASKPIASTLVNYIGSAEKLATDIQPFSQLVGGSSEFGVKRAIDIINANHRSNANDTVFRKGAYTHVLLVSNGDDNEAIYSGGYLDIPATTALQTQRVTQLKQFTRKYYDSLPSGDASKPSLLRSEQFRFITIVPHSSCGNGMINAVRYKDVSRQIYNYSTNSNVTSGSIADSFNLCSQSLANVFQSASQNISQVTVPHIYNWWPVATTNTFDTTQIRVVKSNGYECTRNDLTNGFRYDNVFYNNKNTRESPIPPAGQPAEPYTGYLVELFGNCKATFPECVYVKLQNPPEYRGFIVLDRQPNTSTIAIFKNGTQIPESMVNGWSYYGEFSGNILIKSAADRTPVEPGIYQTGYAIKLNGTAVISNGDKIDYYFTSIATNTP